MTSGKQRQASDGGRAATDAGADQIDDYPALAASAGLQVTAVHDITERHVIIECVPSPP